MSSSQYNLTYFINYMQTEGNKPIDDILANEELRKAFTPFIVNRFISFSSSKINQFVSTHILNRYAFSFYHQPEINFGLMYVLTEKRKERLAYIKSVKDKKKKYSSEVYEAFRKVYGGYHLKIDEINDYIDWLLEHNPRELISMMFKCGYSKKDVQKLFPELKSHLKDIKEPKLTKSEVKKLLKEFQPAEIRIQDKEDKVEELL